MSAGAATISVGLEQVELRPGDGAGNLATALARTRAAFADGADLVVLPELALSGYVVANDDVARLAEPVDGPGVAALIEVAREYDGLVTVGFCERAGSDYFNSVVVVDGEGPVLHYRKLHLFDTEKYAYTPGDLGLPVANTRWGCLAVCICYDLRFVEVLRALILRGADLVIAPAAWVGGFDKHVPVAGATGHVDGVIAQANMNQVAVVAVSQVAGASVGGPATLGGSVAVDAYGELLAGPLSRTGPDHALVEIDLDAVRASRVRGDRIRPRADRRTDVYGVAYRGEIL